jgi:maltooligosyltrehalose trehalohydrolase
MGWDPAVVPDPQDPATFERSRLDWDELGDGRHAVLLGVYRELAALRRQLPELTDPDLRQVDVQVDEEARTLVMRRGSASVVVNFGTAVADIALSGGHEVLFATPAGASLGADGITLPPHAGALVRRTR